jgi:hypothetical protein
MVSYPLVHPALEVPPRLEPTFPGIAIVRFEAFEVGHHGVFAFAWSGVSGSIADSRDLGSGWVGIGDSPSWSRGKEPRAGGETLKASPNPPGLPNDMV